MPRGTTKKRPVATIKFTPKKKGNGRFVQTIRKQGYTIPVYQRKPPYHGYVGNVTKHGYKRE